MSATPSAVIATTDTAGLAEAPDPSRGVVLCVDDESSILSALRRVLRRERYTVLLAESGAAGLALVEEQPVDVIVSDMRMPGMSGAQFLSAVAKQSPDTVRILLTGYADVDSAVSAVNEGGIYRYLTKPWVDDDLRLTVKEALEKRHWLRERGELLDLTARQNIELRTLNDELEQRVLRRTEQLKQSADALQRAYAELEQTFDGTIATFAHLAEMREGTAAGHARRVAELAVELGAVLGLDVQALEDLRIGAQLHDIGKLALSDDLINTPYAALDVAQRVAFQRHAELGEAALTFLEPLSGAARVLRHHHERFDGLGFPDRLAGDAIPMEARIVMVANEFDDLVQGTLVAERMDEARALAFLEANAGKRYDPAVVKALTRLLQGREQAPSRVVRLADLQPGMQLAQDLLLRDQIVLLHKGQKFGPALIDKLRRFLRKEGVEDLEIHVRRDRRD